MAPLDACPDNAPQTRRPAHLTVWSQSGTLGSVKQKG